MKQSTGHKVSTKLTPIECMARKNHSAGSRRAISSASAEKFCQKIAR